MHRIVSMALVFLLVLRGLLGDAMAMGVIPVGAVPAAEHSASAQHASHAEQSDLQHGLHAAVDASTERAEHCKSDAASLKHCGNTQHHTPSCSACDICNSSLHAPAEQVLATESAPQSLQAAPNSRFVSAQSAQVVKPPIS